MAEVIVALDAPTRDEALHIVDLLGDLADFYKVGLQLYTGAGPSVVSELVARDKRVFLDLKLHDIPNTVAGGVAAASSLGVDLLTVHAAGGRAMLEAACQARTGGLRILGVTVLTSLTREELRTVWGREVDSVSDDVIRLAELARDSGVDGVVASAIEAADIRARLGDPFLIVTPGIRPSGADRHDQKRVATPSEAIRAGADYLVVGRPVIRSEDPRAALSAIRDEVARAVVARV